MSYLLSIRYAYLIRTADKLKKFLFRALMFEYEFHIYYNYSNIFLSHTFRLRVQNVSTATLKEAAAVVAHHIHMYFTLSNALIPCHPLSNSRPLCLSLSLPLSLCSLWLLLALATRVCGNKQRKCQILR